MWLWWVDLDKKAKWVLAAYILLTSWEFWLIAASAILFGTTVWRVYC